MNSSYMRHRVPHAAHEKRTDATRVTVPRPQRGVRGASRRFTSLHFTSASCSSKDNDEGANGHGGAGYQPPHRQRETRTRATSILVLDPRIDDRQVSPWRKEAP